MNRQPSPNRNSLDPGAIRQRGHQRSRSASHTETYQSIQQHSPTKFGSAATSRNNLSYSSTSLLSLLSSSTSSPVKAVTKPNHKHRRVQSYSSVTPSSTNSRSNSDEDEEEKDEPIDCYIPVCRTLAQDWYSGGKFHIEGTRFKDCFGRTLQLRGVNLCGHSKLPTSLHSNNPGHPNFFDHRNVSFIGRPFKLEEVDEHFSRLKVWGLTFVRLLVPWEALEHAGPGIYDDEYIDYLIKVLEKAPQYGLKCFIDPHQDVWSRFSGGSGAPGWTFEVAGMDIRKFKVTGAAYIQDMNEQIPVVDGPPPMIWPTNYTKLASSTMFTLFFAGDCFAPKLECQGQSIQRFLQTKFINCYKHLAERLKHLDAVVGFELMNEPHQGYIGLDNLNKYDPISTLIFDDSPSALESFALGHGIPQEVEHWVRSWPFPTRKAGTRLLNTERQSVWLPGFTCPWKEHGVWDVDPSSGQPILLKPDYFIKHPKTGKHVDFNQDFYLPFVNEYAAAIQSVSDSFFVLVEPIPNELPPVYSPTSHHHNIVYAPHWYDLKSVFSKSFNSLITHDVQALRISKNLVRATYFGLHGAKKNYTKQVANIKESGLTRIGAKPVVIGECGIPMDINERKAFETGDYTHHNNFLDAVISAMESNLVHFTLWNYNPGNDNTYGDYWNGEDFSIFSPKQQTQYSSPKAQRRKIKKKKPSNLTIDSTLRPPKASSKSPTSPTTPTTPFEITDIYFTKDTDSHHHLGGRVLDAVIRPYAAKIAGDPVATEFNLKTLDFYLEFEYPNAGYRLYPDAKTQSYFKWFNMAKDGTASVTEVNGNMKTNGISNGDSIDADGVQSTNYPSSKPSSPELSPPGISNLSPILNGSKVSTDVNTTININKPNYGATTLTDIHLPNECYETVIFIPKYHYSHESLVVKVSDGRWSYFRDDQVLYWRIDNLNPGMRHWIQISVKSNEKRTCKSEMKRACNSWCSVM